MHLDTWPLQGRKGLPSQVLVCRRSSPETNFSCPCRARQKPKMEILLARTAGFFEAVTGEGLRNDATIPDGPVYDELDEDGAVSEDSKAGSGEDSNGA